MLNGRVYGVKRIDAQNTNMFVTAKDEDPEFVEWGYGGMGSVKAGKQNGGTQWSRLQSDRGMSGGGAAGMSDNPDDGGGMEWVRKRKEKREREKEEREKEERKAKEKGEAGAVVGDSPVAVVDNQASDPPALPAEEPLPQKEELPTIPTTFVSLSDEPALAVLTPVQERPQQSLLTLPSTDPHHVRTTVTIPAPTQRHHHHRTASHTGSLLTNPNQGDLSGGLGLDGTRDIVTSPIEAPMESLDLDLGVGLALVEAEEKFEDGIIVSGSESENETDSEAEDDQDDDEDEDEVFHRSWIPEIRRWLIILH